MKQFIIRRLLQSIPTLIGASILIFLVFSLAPGDFISAQGNPDLTAERAAELRALYGFDKPLPERYVIWAGNVLQGELGHSLYYRAPVENVLKTFIWNSFLLAIAATAVQWMVASVVGVFVAIKQYTIYDNVVTLLVFIFMSLPSFFIGLYLLKVFAVDYRIFPLGGKITTGTDYTGLAYVWDVMKHMALPVFAMSIVSIGSLTRYFRTNMLEVIKQDYIRTARAKGLKERVVIFKHALRNALLPLITLFALELPTLFSGAVITERIFNWPGIGKIYIDSIHQRDYPLVLAFVMLLAVLTVVANILADVLYGVADPRIRHK
ncbi:ABC transporter permease [Bacillus horti]|uniref:Peptide/nickel transport system permease protein n=1 Tax=Caldalkalibacillus horti TaxID=77523 RepID=A0ABT9W5A4_9BACI|nr:ABC transporter permease [Bacillus horti]MDQ0168244.1 peptide/nickel transport system permease protein [Bacillus horti]